MVCGAGDLALFFESLQMGVYAVWRPDFEVEANLPIRRRIPHFVNNVGLNELENSSLARSEHRAVRGGARIACLALLDRRTIAGDNWDTASVYFRTHDTQITTA